RRRYAPTRAKPFFAFMDTLTRKPPSWCKSLLSRFGTNLYGQPLYRVIWSEDRLEPVPGLPGQHRRRYGNGRDRWMVERWTPPVDYDLVAEPWAIEGDYEWCYTFEADGEFVPLDPSLLELLCQCIERSRLISPEQVRAAIAQRTERERAEEAQRIADMYDEAQGPFGGNEVAGSPGKRTPGDVRVGLTVADLPPGFGANEGFRQVPASAVEQVQ
ncbi:MAG: hypothetical protein KGL39_58075, partial [Patescibacteria group bacterium]|nr:hypothetical protein [Patescibacteria group bacterium]